MTIEKPRVRSIAAMLLSDRSFLRLWLAGACDGTIRWLDVLAVGVFVYEMTRSPLWVSLVLFLRLFPMLIFGLFIGALAERLNRRRLLVFGVSALGSAYAVLGALAFTGQLQIWHVALGCLLSGTFWAAEIPVRRTLLAEVAGVARIGQAMGLESSTHNFTRMLGPTVGGLFLQLVGMHGVYWTGTLLCICSVLLVVPLPVGAARLTAATDAGLISNIRAGLRFVGTQPIIQGVLFITVSVNLFGFSYIGMVPVIGRGELDLSPVQIGMLMSSEGAGAFLTSIVIAVRGVPRHFHRIFYFGSSFYILAVLAFSLVQTFPSALAVLLASGIGLAGFGSMQSALILAQSPPELRNRTMGVLAVCIGFGPLGILNVGFLADQFDPRTAVTIIGCVGFACMTVAGLRWPDLRRERKE